MLSDYIKNDIQKYIEENYAEPEALSKKSSGLGGHWWFKKANSRSESASPTTVVTRSGEILPKFSQGLPVNDAIVDEARCISDYEPSPLISRATYKDIQRVIAMADEGFTVTLLKLIDESGMTDAECYTKAQLNRSHFNKIKNDPDYNIQKETAIALALALELDIEPMQSLLAKASYTLSRSSRFDLIIRYCVEHEIYDVIEVNKILYSFDQKVLGAGIRE